MLKTRERWWGRAHTDKRIRQIDRYRQTTRCTKKKKNKTETERDIKGCPYLHAGHFVDAMKVEESEGESGGSDGGWETG